MKIEKINGFYEVTGRGTVVAVDLVEGLNDAERKAAIGTTVEINNEIFRIKDIESYAILGKVKKLGLLIEENK